VICRACGSEMVEKDYYVLTEYKCTNCKCCFSILNSQDIKKSQHR